MEFEGNDRILLLGKNGSGKSSIIKATKSAFENSRYISYEKSDLCPTQKVTVGLFYQNKLYEIWKGDSYGLKINGEQQNYRNKTSFESDLIDKLPFLKFIDLFFITSDVHNLSKRFTPDRRIELISKFYRLDRIDAYSVTSNNIFQEKLNESSDLKSRIKTESGIRDHILNRVEELRNEVKDLSIDDLRATLKEYNQIRLDYEIFRNWQIENTRLHDRKESILDTLETYKKRLSIDIESVNDRLIIVSNDILNYKNLIENATKRWRVYDEYSTRLNSQMKVGIELKDQLDKINNGRCPVCDAIISNEKSEKLKSEISSKLDSVREECKDLINKLKSYSEEEKRDNYFRELIEELRSKLSESEEECLLLKNKVSQYNIAKSDYDNELLRLKKIDEDIVIHESKKPEEVVIPMNLSELEYEVTSKISKYEDYERESRQYEEKCKLIDDLSNEYNGILEISEKYRQFSELTQRNGRVYEEILKKLADAFSEDDIHYKVDSGVYRGVRYVKFNSFYRVKDKLRIYESLSDGQKSVCDLDFLSKLFSVQMGLLVLDEHLRHLDENNLPKAAEILSNMNVNTIIISTHDSNFSLYTKRVLLELDSNGATKSTIV
jgi:DNA repair exonuclease SbcCD ATPase subunit